ncbi:tRNA nucleotidyltransferase [Microbacterium phage Zooman]|nr:tRNA nucleotidyltransferase [Microbacterium phage Zooman]
MTDDDIKLYLVGGAVRDRLLGLPVKDFDYTVVTRSHPYGPHQLASDAFADMREYLLEKGFNIFLETPEYFTIRARFPKGHVNEKQTADFVLARFDGPYSDGRRPDYVGAGTLQDDLLRRDFTVNAMAEDEDGNIIDLFDGQFHLGKRLLVAVGDPRDRFLEDALRVFRALRFSITKDFKISSDTRQAMHNVGVLDKVEEVSVERIREEMHRCFAHDTVRTVSVLAHEFPELLGVLDRKGIWLKPTLEKK